MWKPLLFPVTPPSRTPPASCRRGRFRLPRTPFPAPRSMAREPRLRWSPGAHWAATSPIPVRLRRKRSGISFRVLSEPDSSPSTPLRESPGFQSRGGSFRSSTSGSSARWEARIGPRRFLPRQPDLQRRSPPISTTPSCKTPHHLRLSALFVTAPVFRKPRPVARRRMSGPRGIVCRPQAASGRSEPPG